jgi:hypothetical protein
MAFIHMSEASATQTLIPMSAGEKSRLRSLTIRTYSGHRSIREKVVTEGGHHEKPLASRGVKQGDATLAVA